MTNAREEPPSRGVEAPLPTEVTSPASDRPSRNESIKAANISDQAAKDDSLGFKPYVEAIAEFLTNEETQPPLTLSIEGSWGSGKSSFMKQLQAEIEQIERLNQRRQPKVVWFNAWRHDKVEALWAAFALEFLRQIATPRTRAEVIPTWRAHWQLIWRRFKWQENWLDAIRLVALSCFLLSLAGIIPVLLFTVGLKGTNEFSSQIVCLLASKTKEDKPKEADGNSTAKPPNSSPASSQTSPTPAASPVRSPSPSPSGTPGGANKEKAGEANKEKCTSADSGLENWLSVVLAIGGLAGSSTGIVALLAKLMDVIGDPKNDLKKYLKSPDYESQVAFIEKFHQDFEKIVCAYAGKGNKVYVFIDDLDRCELTKAADLMQGLNLLISNDPHLIFLLGMDREKVAAAIALKQKDILPYLPSSSVVLDTAKQDSLASTKGLEYGYAFIEKFIQLPFQVPRASEEQFRDFTRTMSSQKTPLADLLYKRFGYQSNVKLKDIKKHFLKLEEWKKIIGSRGLKDKNDWRKAYLLEQQKYLFELIQKWEGGKHSILESHLTDFPNLSESRHKIVRELLNILNTVILNNADLFQSNLVKTGGKKEPDSLDIEESPESKEAKKTKEAKEDIEELHHILRKYKFYRNEFKEDEFRDDVNGLRSDLDIILGLPKSEKTKETQETVQALHEILKELESKSDLDETGGLYDVLERVNLVNFLDYSKFGVPIFNNFLRLYQSRFQGETSILEERESENGASEEIQKALLDPALFDFIKDFKNQRTESEPVPVIIMLILYDNGAELFYLLHYLLKLIKGDFSFAELIARYDEAAESFKKTLPDFAGIKALPKDIRIYSNYLKETCQQRFGLLYIILLAVFKKKSDDKKFDDKIINCLKSQQLIEKPRLSPLIQRPALQKVQETKNLVPTRTDQATRSPQSRREMMKLAVTGDSRTVRDIVLMIAPALEHNPRRIKQFINLFRLRVFIGSNTGLFDEVRAKQDGEAAPVLTLEQLGKFTALCLKYPLLRVDLEKDCTLLANLQRYALGLPYPDPPPGTLIFKRDYDEKTKYWGNQPKLKELLSVGCGLSLYPRVGATYSLEKVNVKQLLQISPGVDPVDRVQLRSEKGIDYKRLRDLLRARQWRKADEETFRVMLKATQREVQFYLDYDNIEHFPCQDLHTIDQLWTAASDDRFGFSVQKRIWQDCGSPMDYNNDWKNFGDRVGWRKEGDWVDYDNLIFDLNAPVGEFPGLGRVVSGAGPREYGVTFPVLSLSHLVRRVAFLLSRRDL